MLIPTDQGDDQARREVVDRFHSLYYALGERTWLNTNWFGVPTSKCPLDLWIYQEIIFEQRPDVIVECGTYRGGSGYYLASICELLGGGRVYSIDVAPRAGRPRHPRLEYLTGSSVSKEVGDELARRIASQESVMVILDSDHSEGHVLAELEAYHQLVAPGGYLIVEDTNVNGHPVEPGFGPGPMEAVESFIARHPEFEIDRHREKLLLTFNPGGFLRRRLPPAGIGVGAVRASVAVTAAAGEIASPAGQALARSGPGAEQRESLRELHDAIDELKQAIAFLHREVASRDAEIRALADELRVVRAQGADAVVGSEERIAELSSALAAAGGETHRLQQALATAEQRWREWQSSRLWRLAEVYWSWRRRLSWRSSAVSRASPPGSSPRR